MNCLYSVFELSFSSANEPPFKKSMNCSSSSKIAAREMGDHMEYLPPISLGNWMAVISSKSNFLAFSICEVTHIKWSLKSKSSPIHALASPRLCIVSSVEKDFEETIKNVSFLFISRAHFFYNLNCYIYFFFFNI